MQITQTLRRRFIRYKKKMVLVLDMTVSERALALRKRVLEMGFPCAVSFPPFAIEHLRPIVCALTFQDVAERIRPSCFGVPMLAWGEGFVSKMLQICVLPTEELLLFQMEKILCRSLGWQRFAVGDREGYYLMRGFTMTSQSIQYQIYSLPLRERDRHILLTLLTSPGIQNTYRRIEAYSFPYPYHTNGNALSETISTHISHINRTMMACGCQKCIRYDRRGQGGYVLCMHAHGNENGI